MPTYGVTETVDVHFEDLDAQGVVHNARYVLLLERALSAYWTRNGYPWDPSSPQFVSVFFVVKQFTITYHAPITRPGPVSVQFWIERPGTTSAVYDFRVVSADETVRTSVTGRPQVLYQTEHPMDFESVLTSEIPLHPLATDATTGAASDLRPLIADPAELRLALRASASLPFLAGPPVTLRGTRFYDAGVAESIPLRTPMAQGAIHIVALRSRPARPLAGAVPPVTPVTRSQAARADSAAERVP